MPEIVDGRLRVWTDGSCYPNPGPGGWAWALDRETFASGPARVTTNNRMEMMAAIRAIQANEGPLEVFSDSQYVCGCFRDQWYRTWIRQGWQHKGVDRKNRAISLSVRAKDEADEKDAIATVNKQEDANFSNNAMAEAFKAAKGE